MKQFLLPLLVILTILTTSKLASQNTLLSLSGTYGIVINDHRPDISFNAIGTSLGLEDRYKKHFTVGGDIDWQRFESEPAIALPLTDPSLSPVIYSIDRHQFNIRPTIRYYFKEAFQGLYVGVFGTYSYLTVKTSDYPQNSSYLPSIYTDPPDDFGGGLGLTYGYRLKLTSALKASVFGSHQLFQNNIPKYLQQDHQFGLGLNWAF